MLIVIWLVCGFFAAGIASSKGRSGCGWFLLGIAFGPFALLGAAVMSKDAQAMLARDLASGAKLPCPTCREPIHPAATICPHCRSAVDRRRPDAGPTILEIALTWTGRRVVTLYRLAANAISKWRKDRTG